MTEGQKVESDRWGLSILVEGERGSLYRDSIYYNSLYSYSLYLLIASVMLKCSEYCVSHRNSEYNPNTCE